MKNCISICSNSRIRNINWRATISLRKAFPVWAIPKGIFIRPDFWTFKKFTKIPWAVSGRRYKSIEASAEAPILVPNIRLNCFTSVQLREPVSGSAISNSSMSAFTSARLSVSNDLAKRDKISCPRCLYSSTRGLVATNCSKSKASPKRFCALATSFSIFSSNLAT